MNDTTNIYEPPSSDVVVSVARAEGRLYTAKQIAAGAFLGSIMAGFWLIAANYRVLANERARKICLIAGVIATLAWFVFALQLPDNVPASSLTLVHVLATWYLADRLQGDALDEHNEADGPLRSNWRVVGVSLACMLIVCLLVGVSIGLLSLMFPGLIDFV